MMAGSADSAGVFDERAAIQEWDASEPLRADWNGDKNHYLAYAKFTPYLDDVDPLAPLAVKAIRDRPLAFIEALELASIDALKPARLMAIMCVERYLDAKGAASTAHSSERIRGDLQQIESALSTLEIKLNGLDLDEKEWLDIRLRPVPGLYEYAVAKDDILKLMSNRVGRVLTSPTDDFLNLVSEVKERIAYVDLAEGRIHTSEIPRQRGPRPSTISTLIEGAVEIFQEIGLANETEFKPSGRFGMFISKLHELAAGEPDKNFSASIKPILLRLGFTQAQ